MIGVAGILGGALLCAIHGATVQNTLFISIPLRVGSMDFGFALLNMSSIPLFILISSINLYWMSLILP